MFLFALEFEFVHFAQRVAEATTSKRQQPTSPVPSSLATSASLTLLTSDSTSTTTFAPVSLTPESGQPVLPAETSQDRPPHPEDIFGPLLPSYRIGPVVRLRKKRRQQQQQQQHRPQSQVHRNHVRLRTPVSLEASFLTPSVTERHHVSSHQRSLVDNPRLGSLSIEWFDFESDDAGTSMESFAADPAAASATDASISATSSSVTASKVTQPGRAASPARKRYSYIVPTSGAFIPFKSGSTQLNAGILHLYRERSEVCEILDRNSIDAEDAPLHLTREAGGGTVGHIGSEGDTNLLHRGVKGAGNVLCVLAVPSYMTTQDFLTFIGPSRKTVSHVRVVRDSLPNRYMVLMKFRSQQGADEFYRAYSGRSFTSFDSDLCHVVYIKSIEFKSQAIPPFAFPPTVTGGDPNSVFATLRGHDDNVQVQAQQIEASSTPSHGLSPTSPTPTSAVDSHHQQLIELPICPVCLDRMDSSVTGLVTIVCHHTFHCNCLSKWGDTSCPVCRYSQNHGIGTYSSGVGRENESGVGLNECNDCGATTDLWICLICGNIGCGRYGAGAHAAKHYDETNHLYALELETQRVWDYAGDGYVHRLIQNKADGKLVELPARGDDNRENTDRGPALFFVGSGDGDARANSGAEWNRIEGSDGKGGVISREKLDAISLEYTYLLTTQLESQRIWYESQMIEMQRAADARVTEILGAEPADSSSTRAETPTTPIPQPSSPARTSGAKASGNSSESATANVLREKRLVERKLDRLLERVSTLERAYADEREINESLRRNQDSFRAQVEEKDRTISELSEQVRDLMFYLETQQKVDQSPLRDELLGGTVVVESTGSGSGPSSFSGSASRGIKKTQKFRKK